MATDDELRAAVEAFEGNGKHYRNAAAALGLAPSTLQGRLKRAAERGLTGNPPLGVGDMPAEGFRIVGNAGQFDANGNLQKQWLQTKPDSGEVYETPAGHVVKGESALVDPDGRVLAKWIKTREGSGDGAIDALRAAFAEYSGAAPLIPAPVDTDDALLTVYPLPDLHLGMYAWRREAGENYDVDIAVKMATESIAHLVSQSRPSRNAIVLGLGDYFHANDAKNVTPGSGHSLDVDGRHAKVFHAGARLATSIVDLVSQKHESVNVRFLPGNHDPDASMCLTVALGLFYNANPRIKVDESPGIAWWHRFGKVLLGATHGHTMKPEAMAMMMAVDRASDWGETIFRHILFGHIHHEVAKEVAGVRVESLQSPAAKDAWNAASGYRAGRSMTALTFHRERGEIGRHRINII